MMQTTALCFFIFHIFSLCLCFHVNVQVKNDNGDVVEEWSEEKDLENNFQEDPPFRTLPRQDVEQTDDSLDYVDGIRFKRSFGKDLMKMSSDECTDNLRQMKRISKGKAMQLVYILEPGDNMKMSCDMCGNEAMLLENIMWKKMDRVSAMGGEAISLVNVRMDMHDDESRNRVYMKADKHTSLIITNVTYEDAGTYFCIQKHELYGRFQGHVKALMTPKAIHKLFTTENLFNFYYHVEVLPKSKVPAILVSSDGTIYPRALPPYYVDEFVFYSDWSKWSPCSACGEVGERKRHGVCAVKFNPKKKVKFFNPVFVYHLLKSVPRGIPCRSTLFSNFNFKRTRQDEIMIQSCNEPCQKLGEGVKFSGVKIGKVKFKKKVPQHEVSAIVGQKVELECPGATLDTIIYWINGTKYVPTMVLLNLTSNRAEIDVYGFFRIHAVELIDSGTYSCWHHDEKKGIYKLRVKPLEDKDSWKRHFKYLCLSFFADFWIFLIILVIKHKNRRVQLSVYNRDGYKWLSSDSETLSHTNSYLSDKWDSLDDLDKGSIYSNETNWSDKQNIDHEHRSNYSNISYSRRTIYSDEG